MRLATWNCAMALQKKLSAFLALDIDLMVIQECSKMSIDSLNKSNDFSAVWFGENPHKGLGIVIKSPWKIDEVQSFKLNWVGNVKVVGPVEFDLFGVWACASHRYDDRYIRQVHLLLDQLEQSVLGPQTILMGDFNSNAIWDKNYRGRGHSAAVERLEILGLKSAYHVYHKENQGNESHPTLYFRKQRASPYHIDYVFLTNTLLQSLKSVVVGQHDDWIRHSDHMPLIAELKLKI